MQLLGADGTVLDSTTTDRDGRYHFDDLAAGAYSLRFAGVPAGSRLSPAGVGGATGDSDPDYTGVTPSFDLGVDRPGVRPSVAADAVRAGYVLDTVDAGISRLTYAVGSVVWQDLDRDGLLDPDEPPGKAEVTLLDGRGDEVASVAADDQGRFLFDRLAAGTYRLRFDDLGAHRQLTAARIGNNRAVSSAADPRTGTTRPFSLDPAEPDLVPATDFGDVDADYVKATLNVGTVGSFEITNRVWRDTDGDGVLSPGEAGVGGVRVELLDARGGVVATTVTGRSGRYSFDRLTGGQYKLRFSHLPKGLFFTAPGVGGDRAVDSDVYGDAVTAPITVSEDHPVESGIAAGLSTSATAAVGTTAPPVPGNRDARRGGPARNRPGGPRHRGRDRPPRAGPVRRRSPPAPSPALAAGRTAADGGCGQEVVVRRSWSGAHGRRGQQAEVDQTGHHRARGAAHAAQPAPHPGGCGEVPPLQAGADARAVGEHQQLGGLGRLRPVHQGLHQHDQRGDRPAGVDQLRALRRADRERQVRLHQHGQPLGQADGGGPLAPRLRRRLEVGPQAAGLDHLDRPDPARRVREGHLDLHRVQRTRGGDHPGGVARQVVEVAQRRLRRHHPQPRAASGPRGRRGCPHRRS